MNHGSKRLFIGVHSHPFAVGNLERRPFVRFAPLYGNPKPLEIRFRSRLRNWKPRMNTNGHKSRAVRLLPIGYWLSPNNPNLGTSASRADTLLFAAARLVSRLKHLSA